jgi:hypothetical protein
MTARNATSLLARQPQGLYAEYARRSLTRSAIRSVENLVGFTLGASLLSN